MTSKVGFVHYDECERQLQQYRSQIEQSDRPFPPQVEYPNPLPPVSSRIKAMHPAFADTDWSSRAGHSCSAGSVEDMSGHEFREFAQQVRNNLRADVHDELLGFMKTLQDFCETLLLGFVSQGDGCSVTSGPELSEVGSQDLKHGLIITDHERRVRRVLKNKVSSLEGEVAHLRRQLASDNMDERESISAVEAAASRGTMYRRMSSGESAELEFVSNTNSIHSYSSQPPYRSESPRSGGENHRKRGPATGEEKEGAVATGTGALDASTASSNAARMRRAARMRAMTAQNEELTPGQTDDVDSDEEHDWMFRNRRGFRAQQEINLVKGERDLLQQLQGKKHLEWEKDPETDVNSSAHGANGQRTGGSCIEKTWSGQLHEVPEVPEDVDVEKTALKRSPRLTEPSGLTEDGGSIGSAAPAERRSPTTRLTKASGMFPMGLITRSSRVVGRESDNETNWTESQGMDFINRHSKIFYHKNKAGKKNLKNQKTLSAHHIDSNQWRIAIVTLVSSLWFDGILGCSIFMNALLIGVQADWQVRHRGQEIPSYMRVFDLTFCVIFVVELSLRIFAFQWRFYSMKGWGWNVFDTFIVMAQVLEEALMFFAHSYMRNLSFMRIMRIFRLIRIIRLVRILRIIGELRLLVLSIVHSLKSLCWTIVLIVLMMYINAIWLTQVVADESGDNDDSRIFYYYGSLPASILSLFQSITGGIDWDDAMRPLVDDISPVWGLIYCIYIAFSVFAMLNVVTGVFVESALQSANEDKDIIMVNTMGDFFKKASGAKGTMSWADFHGNLSTPHMQDYFKLIDIDISEARAIFRLLDLNHSGSITVDEFLSGCVRLRGSAKALDLAMLMHEVRRIETMLKEMKGIPSRQEKSRVQKTDKVSLFAAGRDTRFDGREHRLEGSTRLEVPVLRHTALKNYDSGQPNFLT